MCKNHEEHEHHHDEDCCCCECCEEEKELVRDRRELTDEEIESIIVEKYNTKDEKTKVFIRKALKVHGNWYDYSKVEYKNANTKVTIICPIHGDFEQRPDCHIMRKHGCPKCARKANGDRCRKTRERFIEEATKVHNGKYNYDKVNYIDAHTKVVITCPIHGDFEQTPDNHVSRKRGCPKCNGGVSISQEQFIEKATKVHNGKYNYDKVNYINTHTKVTITCPIHGDFEQTPSIHLGGDYGCPKCAIEANSENKRKSREQFIKEAREIHGSRYNYDKVNYVSTHTKVVITCPIHGDFEQTPAAHLRNQGCPHCHDSIGEKLIARLLTKNNVLFNQHIRIDSEVRVMFPDFILIDSNVWIEYNGEQHYFKSKFFHKDIADFMDQLDRDINKRSYCRDNGIRLIEIPYTIKTLNSISDFLDKVLLQNIDPNTLVDYSKLYKLDNTGLNLEDLFPT